MKHKMFIFVTIFAAALSMPLQAVSVNASRKVVTETIAIAAKRSGRALTPAARIAMEEAAAKAFAQYGDDVLHVLEKGGLEALDQGARHGKDFWRLSAHATPQAARSLALHADELMPLARRIGPEFVTLEGKVPGLGAECVRLFGDDAAKSLAHAPAGEITQLVGYARRADSPQTVRVLNEAYQKSGGEVLKHLNWKHIMAAGLSASAVVTAYKLSGGVEKLATEHPEHFTRQINRWSLPLQALLWGIAILLFWQLYRILRKSGRWMVSKIPQPKQEKDMRNDKTEPKSAGEKKSV